jgi:betaine-aldehyde dehydrogenase
MSSVESRPQGNRKLYIGGQWIDSFSTGEIPMVNPATDEVFAYAPDTTIQDADRAIAAARQAFDEGPWPRMAPTERLACLQRLSDLYSDKYEDIAQLITAEIGSPIMFSRHAHVPIAKMMLDYYVGLAKDYPFEETREGRSLAARVIKEPVGVCVAIAPWNFPQAAMMLKLAPALIAGCTVVAKPGSETAQDALAMAELFDAAGFPPGVVSILPAGREVGEYLVSHRDVDHVSFTGSTASGRRVAEICGRDLRRCNLELGGKSALIMLEDADLEKAVKGVWDQGMRNSGQACTNQTRILVPRALYCDVLAAITDMIGKIVVGDPLDPATQVGPVASQAQYDRVMNYIRIGKEEGARVTVGGGRPQGMAVGRFIEPTVFGDVNNSMRIAREEIFGPVLAVIPFDDDADAVRIANDSEYGLAGGVWSKDLARADSVVRRIRSGMLHINGVGGSFDAPFGGFKASGLGRESGREGLETYFEYKSLPLLG